MGCAWSTNFTQQTTIIARCISLLHVPHRLTGDFLNERRRECLRRLDLASWGLAPHIEVAFPHRPTPRPGDASYWQRFYSLEVTPEQLRDVDGLVVLAALGQASTFDGGRAIWS